MEELKTTIKSWYDKQSYYIQNRIEHFEIGRMFHMDTALVNYIVAKYMITMV